LRAVEVCCAAAVPVLLQKPIATQTSEAEEIVRRAEAAGIVLGVVSQHRFDDSILFLKRALHNGRLGRLLQADTYVKWFRSDAYYARPGKGAWSVEGGGALINQAIHQADVLLYLAGPVTGVYGMWQLGAAHTIESEDVVNGLLRYQSGATGVLQAATAFWPGYPERIELHGTNGTAIVSGDQLTTWDVLNDVAAETDPAPVRPAVASGASDPMAIGLTAFERQFAEFARAVQDHTQPSTDGIAGLRALRLVTGIYQACRTDSFVQLTS
jgi:predicted dehydrogenase